MHVKVVKTAELPKRQLAYVGRVGRVVEKYLFPDRSRVMFAGGHEEILPDAALEKAKSPRVSHR